MGLFDTIECQVEETKPYWDEDFQTKDLENCMIHYKLNHDGLFQLTETGMFFEEIEKDENQKVNYTGKIRFYIKDKDGNWIEFWALLDRGDVLWIKNKDEL